MKKTAVICISFSVIIFASCKKHYNCVCTYLDSNNAYKTDTTELHSTRNTAQIDCNNKAKALTQYGRTVVCEL